MGMALLPWVPEVYFSRRVGTSTPRFITNHKFTPGVYIRDVHGIRSRSRFQHVFTYDFMTPECKKKISVSRNRNYQALESTYKITAVCTQAGVRPTKKRKSDGSIPCDLCQSIFRCARFRVLCAFLCDIWRKTRVCFAD